MTPLPDFFFYGKDERTQDAVICWLIAWAARPEKACKNDEERLLRAFGLRFVEALFSHKRGVRVSFAGDISAVIHQQEKGIDILVLITDLVSGAQYVLLIEDKVVGGGEDQGKLNRYYREVIEGKTRLGHVDPRIVFPIFLSTGKQSIWQDKWVAEQIENTPNCDYKFLSRRDFLKVLDGYEGSHPLLIDFRAHLRRENFRSWKQGGERTADGWQELFMWLEEEMRAREERENPGGPKYDWMDWGYVPFPGDFWGFYWEPSGGADGLYLQIEGEGELRFRINGKRIPAEVKPREFAMEWLERLLQACGDCIEKVDRLKPKRDGSFAFAKWRKPWMAFDERTGLLDVDATADNLRKAEACLRKAVEAARKKEKS